MICVVGSSLDAKVSCIIHSPMVYYLWQKRNHRICQRVLMNQISQEIRIKASMFKSVNPSSLNLLLCNNWTVPHSIFEQL